MFSISTGTSYRDYLREVSFTDRTYWQASQNTLQHIATREELRQAGIRVADSVSHASDRNIEAISRQTELIQDQLGRVDESIREGFETLRVDVQETTAAVEDLTAKFDVYAAQNLAILGRINDTLEELLKFAATPEQRWAYEQFAIARDAVRRQLFGEAIQHLEYAIVGYSGHPGYRLEPRFHFLMGQIYLGSPDNYEAGIVDLPKAEASFSDAARYFRHDYPGQAALALHLAGYTSYCAGRPESALEYGLKALELMPAFAEAQFWCAKYAFVLGRKDEGLSFLRSAALLDPLYSVKWESDPDFRPYATPIHGLFDNLRLELKDVAERYAREVVAVETKVQELTKQLVSAVTVPPSVRDFRRASVNEGKTFMSAYRARQDMMAASASLAAMLDSMGNWIGSDGLRLAGHSGVDLSDSAIEKETKARADKLNERVGQAFLIIPGILILILLAAAVESYYTTSGWVFFERLLSLVLGGGILVVVVLFGSGILGMIAGWVARLAGQSSIKTDLQRFRDGHVEAIRSRQGKLMEIRNQVLQAQQELRSLRPPELTSR